MRHTVDFMTVAQNGNRQHHAAFDTVFPAAQTGEEDQLLRLDLGKIADASQIDAENGDFALCTGGCSFDDGAVTAEHDRTVTVVKQCMIGDKHRCRRELCAECLAHRLRQYRLCAASCKHRDRIVRQ